MFVLIADRRIISEAQRNVVSTEKHYKDHLQQKVRTCRVQVCETLYLQQNVPCVLLALPLNERFYV